MELSKTELARRTYTRYSDVAKAPQLTNARKRLARNWSYYAGIDDGQWSSALAEQMREAGYPVHTYNRIFGAVNLIQGHLQQSPIDAELTTPIKEDQEEVDVMQSLMEIDLTACSYDRHEATLIRDGLVKEGWVQIYPSFENDLRGNVAIRAIDPNYVFPSPSWVSDNFADCDELFRSEWMTAEQVKATYNKKSSEIEQAIESYNASLAMPNSTIDRVADRHPDYYDDIGGRYRVIERHYIKEQSVRAVVDLWTGRELSKDELPADAQSLGDDILKMMLTIKKGEIGRYVITRKRVRTSMLTTVCPGLGLDLVLADGEYPIQCGQLPFGNWTYCRVHGETIGIPDLLIDPQTVINVRESQITRLLNNKANQNWMVESGAFANDNARIDDFRKRANRSGQTFMVEDGTISQKKIAPLHDETITADLFQSTNHAHEMITTLANIGSILQPQAMQQGNESGVLFEANHAQAMVAFESIVESLKRFKEDLVRLYIKAAVDWYGTAPRQVFDPRSGEVLVINAPIPTPDGASKMLTLRDAQWYGVQLVMRRLGNARKVTQMGQLAMLNRTITNPMAKAAIESQIIDLSDVDANTKELAKAACMEQAKMMMAQSQAQTAQAQAVTQQAQAQATQATAQAQPQPQSGLAPQAPQGA